METRLIAQGVPQATTLEAALKQAATAGYDRLDVAVAYATKQGLLTLRGALGGFPAKSRWVVGLDDAITQPEALTELHALPGAELRLAQLAPTRRFHAKLYRLWRSDDPAATISAIGSGNMTLNGLRQNGEVAVLATAQSGAEATMLQQQWEAMWSLGVPATTAAIEAYRLVYGEVRKKRDKIVAQGVAPPEPSPDAPVPEMSRFDGNPVSAQTAWLEAGSPSAGGRDLEFPKAMMPFFGLGKSPEHRWIRVPGGRRFLLTFTERTDNQMWRLLFTSESIAAAAGRETMRPLTGGNRSDLAITFTRVLGSQDLAVDMVMIGGTDHSTLLAKSQAVGGLNRTRNPGGRNFGFF